MWSEDGEVILEVTMVLHQWVSSGRCGVGLFSFALSTLRPNRSVEAFPAASHIWITFGFSEYVKRKRPCPCPCDWNFNPYLGFQPLLQWFLFPAAGRNPKRPLFPLVFAKVSCNSSAVQTFHHLTPFWPLLSGFAGTMRGKSRRFCSCKTRRSCTGWTSTTPSPSGRWARWSTPIKRCRLFHPISCSVAQ